MRGLDAVTLQRFLERAGERLTGDWVVIGGCVLPLLGVHHRVTYDIDVAGPDEADMGQMRILMEIAEELGLPVHAVNQAGSFFLHDIDGWENRLVELHRGTGATLYVPDPTLFLLLKLRRLSESDLADCRAMASRARSEGEPIDAARVLSAVADQVRRSPPPDRAARLEQLRELIQDGEPS